MLSNDVLSIILTGHYALRVTHNLNELEYGVVPNAIALSGLLRADDLIQILSECGEKLPEDEKQALAHYQTFYKHLPSVNEIICGPLSYGKHMIKLRERLIHHFNQALNTLIDRAYAALTPSTKPIYVILISNIDCLLSDRNGNIPFLRVKPDDIKFQVIRQDNSLDLLEQLTPHLLTRHAQPDCVATPSTFSPMNAAITLGFFALTLGGVKKLIENYTIGSSPTV
ncbi:MAG: hypothetical protein NTW08_09795 [Gammaproteobacteria bacterium]|nr:hypothetical protein [Gammaproteobacteria bacterium]